MDKEYIIPVIVGVILIGFVFYNMAPDQMKIETLDGTDPIYITLEPPYTVEETFYMIRQLDIRYGTDFRNETLKGNVVRIGVAEEYLERLEEINATVMAEPEAGHEAYVSDLIGARENMLWSQIYFQQALSYGRKGTFREDKNCEDEKTILEATRLYNMSRAHGARAMAKFDKLLNYVPAHSYVGINEHRPAWYSDVFRDMGALITTNTEALEMFCENGVLKEEGPKVEGGSIKRYIGSYSS